MVDAQRGEVYDADLGPLGIRPVVVLTRTEAIPVLTRVTVVLVTGTIRNHRAEVALDESEGLDRECVANCDDLATLPKHRLLSRRGALGSERMARLDDALRFALALGE